MLKSTSIHKGVYNTLSVIKHVLKSYRPVCLYKHALLRKDGIIPGNVRKSASDLLANVFQSTSFYLFSF